MKNTFSMIALVALAIILFMLLSRLLIFPLVVEERVFSSEGETLYQKWELVSLGEYYEYSRFAKTAWLESTGRVYRALLIVHTLALGVFSFAGAKLLMKRWQAG